MESNILAVTTPLPLSDEDHMAVALENARISEEFKEFQFRGRQNVSDQSHGQDMHIAHNHFNLVSAEEGK